MGGNLPDGEGQGLGLDALTPAGRSVRGRRCVGQVVAASECSTLGLELRTGQYRALVHAPGQESSHTVQIGANKDTVIKVSLEGDRFVLVSG